MKSRCFAWKSLPVIEMDDRIKLRSVSGERLLVAKYKLEAGATVAQHQHPHEQVICVLSGRIDFEISGEPYLLEADDVVHIPSNVSHGGTAVEDTITIEAFSPPRPDLMAPVD